MSVIDTIVNRWGKDIVGDRKIRIYKLKEYPYAERKMYRLCDVDVKRVGDSAFIYFDGSGFYYEGDPRPYYAIKARIASIAAESIDVSVSDTDAVIIDLFEYKGKV